MPVHAAAREGSLDVLQYLYGAGFDMTGAFAVGLERPALAASMPGCAAGSNAAPFFTPFPAALFLNTPWPRPAPCPQSWTASASRRCTMPPLARASQGWRHGVVPPTARWLRCCWPAAAAWSVPTRMAAHRCTLRQVGPRGGGGPGANASPSAVLLS